VYFLSTYEHTIDAKNRLALPAEVRSIVNEKVHGEGWVAGPGPNVLLTLWPTQTFERMLDPYSKDALGNAEIGDWRTMLYRHSARLDMDSAGRIRIPDRLRRMFGLNSNVVILGAGESLELMDAEQWKVQEQLDLSVISATWKKASMARNAARPEAANR